MTICPKYLVAQDKDANNCQICNEDTIMCILTYVTIKGHLASSSLGKLVEMSSLFFSWNMMYRSKTFDGQTRPILKHNRKNSKKFVMPFNHKPKMNLPKNTHSCLEMHCGQDPFEKIKKCWSIRIHERRISFLDFLYQCVLYIQAVQKMYCWTKNSLIFHGLNMQSVFVRYHKKKQI